MASAGVQLGRAQESSGIPLEVRLNAGIRILLVEDETFLRTVIGRVLSDAGYEVITAKDAREAFHQFGVAEGNVDLLITDVILPGRNGHRLAAQLLAQRPALKTLLISGYPERVVQSCQLNSSLGFCYLPKPFSSDVLTRKVRDLLTR